VVATAESDPKAVLDPRRPLRCSIPLGVLCVVKCEGELAAYDSLDVTATG